MQCDERCSIRERKRERDICANIRNANQRYNSLDQLKKPDTLEETR